MLGMPSNIKIFYNLYLKGAENSYKSARELRELVDELHNPEQRLSNLSKYKEESKSIMMNTTEYTAKSFSTPFDRDDVLKISEDLYNLTNNIEKVASSFYTHCITQKTPEAAELLESLLTAVQYIVDVFTNLAQSKDRNLVINSITEVDKTVAEAELKYRHAVKKLFHDYRDELYLVKWNSLYKYLEIGTNSCRQVGKDMRDILGGLE